MIWAERRGDLPVCEGKVFLISLVERCLMIRRTVRAIRMQ